MNVDIDQLREEYKQYLSDPDGNEDLLKKFALEIMPSLAAEVKELRAANARMKKTVINERQEGRVYQEAYYDRLAKLNQIPGY